MSIRPESASPPRVALLASGSEAAEFAALVTRSGSFELVAQAGMAKTEAAADIEWHNDARALLAQAEIDAVIVAGSHAEGVAAIQIAAECAKHAWRWGPIGRDLAEGLDGAARMQAAKRVLWPASWVRHVRPLLTETFVTTARRATYATLDITAPGPSYESWRASARSAAGGVLAQDGFFWLEALIALRGLPEYAQGATRRDQRAPAAPPRETEDIACAMLRDSGGLTSIRARWADAAPIAELVIHAPADGAANDAQPPATARLTGVAAETPDEATPGRVTLPGMNQDAWILDDLRAFAAAVRDHGVAERVAERAAHSEAVLARRVPGLAPKRDLAPPTGAASDADAALDLSLATTALLETIYLSARTMSSEQPRKLYEAQRCPCPF